MSEERIPKEEIPDNTAESVKTAEPMGTVIAMESIKPIAAEPKEAPSVPEEKEHTDTAQKPEESQQSAQPEPTAPVNTFSSGHTEERSIERPPVRELHEEPDYEDPFEDESESDRGKRRFRDFFRSKKSVNNFTREDWILSRLPEENLMEYLRLEHQRNESMQAAREKKEKRIFTTVQIIVSLAAIVAVVWLLKDNPTVLVNILYIAGIVIALWIWKGKQDK